MTRQLLCVAAAAALLTSGCKAQAPAAATTATPAATLSAAPKPGFDVAVTLSPAATAKLAGAHETIIVAAEYMGELNDEGRKRHLGDEMDQVYFGAEKTVEIPAAGTAHFDPPPSDAEKLKYVTGGKVTVNINVYTGRHSSQDNLISCNAFQDTLDVAERAPIKIACKLITEADSQ